MRNHQSSRPGRRDRLVDAVGWVGKVGPIRREDLRARQPKITSYSSVGTLTWVCVRAPLGGPEHRIPEEYEPGELAG